MSTVRKLASRFVSEEDGAGLIEYALLCALIALAAVVGMGILGGGINTLFTNIGNEVNDAQVPDIP
jgi:pilus assembly protein Flp/PilA